jgi:predicted ATPase/class 3 adenylate cyclase
MESGVHRIIPELIIENYRVGRHRGSFEAASLFLDISGFSVMTDALMGQGRDGAEVLAVMMGTVFDPLVEAIFGQGGMIVGYAGDSITALFEVDTDEASAARRALASAHSIQEELAAKPLFETPFGSFHISAKIGLAFGSVSWGILPSRKGDRAVYYFRGDAVDEAARAEHQSSAGEVVLTSGIHGHLGAEVETKPRADLHILHRVSGTLPAPRPVRLPPIDPAIAAIFAPRELVTRDLQGEFRQTVPTFLRIPDLTDDGLQQFIHALFDLQARYGGLIDRVDFGDKGCTVVVLWGAPLAHENDIDRALSFLLDLRAQVDFPLTAGITYYISYAGYIGGHLFETYTAYGWGMNLAARFMMGASKNEIWLDERISQRISERFHFEFVGEQGFKGFAQKQKVFVLGGRKSGAEVFFRGKMAGRESELRALADFTAPLWDGKYAGVAGVWGEAGMGKSRLVYEFRRSPVFQGRSCLWAACQSDEILQRSFNPFRYWLFRYFELLPAHDSAARSQKLLKKLDELIAFTARASLAAELKHARSFLATLVDVEWPDSPYEQLDAQGRYDNTIIALISLLKAESLRQPLILFFEDAQYLDEDSKAFLPRLKRALAADPVPYPIAILMAARWQASKSLLEDGLVDRDIELAGLPNDSIASLCGDLLGQPAAPALAKLVNERAEGNPFFTEQVLRFLQEQDLLETNASGEWIVKPRGKSPVLPSDTSAMLVARLDKLAPHVKEVIQAASVLGRTFDLPVLAHMLGDDASLQNGIAAAEQAAVWSPLSETRYIFNHALLRDVAYNMQLQSRRRALHARAFHALEDLFGSQVHRHYGELAYHSEQAALPLEARRCLELAGDAARDEYQNAQALDFYRRVLDYLPETDLRERYRLHRECEKIVTERGGLEERTQEIDALQALADAIGEPGDLAEVMLLRSRLANSSGQYDESANLAAQAKELALEASRNDVAIGAYMALLDASYQRGIYKEAVDYGEAGIALARQQHATQEEASLLNVLGLAVLEMKNPSTARGYFDQSLSIFRAEANVRGVANVLGNLGSVAGYQGNYTAALDYYEQSLRLTREIGSRKGECPRLTNMGWLSGLLGDYVKAQAYIEQAVQIAREVGDRYIETFCLINLSSHAGAMGQFTSAIEYAEQGLALARESNDRSAQAWALTYLGHGLFECGRTDPARNAYAEALQLRRDLDQPALATEPAAGLARISWLHGDPASAKEHVDAILAQLEQDGTLEGTDQPLRVYLSCYLVLSGMEDPRASGILNTAHDMLKTRANGIPDPSGRQVFLEKITYNREILSLWEQRHGG